MQRTLSLLKQRTALVTGSTSGIGLAVAKHFAQIGHNVVLNGFGDPDAAVKEVQAVSSAVKVGYVGGDLSKTQDCHSLIDKAHALNGRLDVLVNNAGIQFVSPVATFPEEQWDRIISINLSSVFHCSKRALGFMEQQGFGRIINIASVHGLVASANKSAYVAAKHGVIGFTKTLALETAKKNITVNAVCPGWVLTPLVEQQIKAKAAEKSISYEQAMDLLVGEKMPSSVPASGEEIALAVAFFADERNVSTRGVALNVDGGWVAQ